MKKLIKISSVLFTVALLTGCAQQQINQNRPVTSAPAEQQIPDQNQSTPSAPIVQQPSQSAPATNQQTAPQTNNDEVGWKTYSSDKYGFSFSYPENFRVITDKIQVQYINHPKGFNWYRIEFTNASIPEKPFIRFEIDPDGYGPFFPDKTFQITEDKTGKIIIGQAKTYNDENTNDGKTLIIPNLFTASNGHSYSWQFSYNEGGQDYETLFRQILATFKFKK